MKVEVRCDREEVEILRTSVPEVNGERGAADEVKELRLWESSYAIQSEELFMRKVGAAARASFSASKNARQKPRVRSVTSGAQTSRKKEWMRPRIRRAALEGSCEPAFLEESSRHSAPTRQAADSDVTRAMCATRSRLTRYGGTDGG